MAPLRDSMRHCEKTQKRLAPLRDYVGSDEVMRSMRAYDRLQRAEVQHGVEPPRRARHVDHAAATADAAARPGGGAARHLALLTSVMAKKPLSNLRNTRTHAHTHTASWRCQARAS